VKSQAVQKQLTEQGSLKNSSNLFAAKNGQKAILLRGIASEALNIWQEKQIFMIRISVEVL
jgi:hypothetical protein